MTKICVNYSSYTNVEAEHNFGGEFSGEDTHTTHDKHMNLKVTYGN